ncbi:MAG: lysophospholipid acyltransferase family protein [Capnocytophaga sp.]|uniref:lysophospholipid acyltransferase family protein n=1 Tax=Capnocytophaga sp. TaxID=44737 RepID=UPI003F9F6A3C
MKILKYPFWCLWKIWFYVLVVSLILLLLPILLVLTAKARWYRSLYWVVRHLWATPILYGMGFWPKLKKACTIPDDEHSYMLIANHYSMMDIMLMLYVSKRPFVFVGKKELSKLPLFGYFYRRAAIMVDRKSSQSRKEVYRQAMERIAAGLSICIFPEGGVPDDESIVLDSFKDGAFRIAIECQIPIVPMLFYDTKKRFPFRFFAGCMGEMRVEVLPLVATEGKTLADKDALREAMHAIMLQKLTAALDETRTSQ